MPLSRADVRDEIRDALSKFAEDVLRSEIEKLSKVVRQALQDAMPEDLADGLLQRKDLHRALDEWWASSRPNNAPFQPEPPFKHLNCLAREPACCGRSGTAPVSLPTSPVSLPAAFPSSDGLDVPTPFSSPASSPASAPAVPQTPSAVLSALPPSHASRRDWRRTFVERARKANRKVEYLHGSQCRETHGVADALEEAERALEDGVKPHLVEDGLGGTYFIADRAGHSIAIFKPRDEEPLAPNNPKVHAGEGSGEGLKGGVLVGEAALHEYAAFLLDQAAGPCLRAGVMPTALVRVAHSVFHSAEEGRRSAFRQIKDKVGSFQLFAQHDCTSEDLGPSLFPAEQVHRLAALDIRLCNTDVTFEWLSWPAARKPFSEELRREILALDVQAAEAVLKKRVPMLRPECLASLRVCTMLLRCGTEAGLTAFQIGSMMVRPYSFGHDPPEPSTLEELVAASKRQAEDAESWEHVLEGLIGKKCRALAEDL